jgi:superfamily I DNA/RNA helicase
MHVLQLRHGLRAPSSERSVALRKLIALDLSGEQRDAVEAPFDCCVAIVGPPASGKSTALAQRLARARELYPAAEPLIIDATHPLEAYALALLRERGIAASLVDDAEAELLFRDACAPLFELEWSDFAENQIDPEVPGLRSPQRFFESAFRLIRRLRDAGIEPAAFLQRALTAATEFYANPPNFADPRLLAATKSNFHDSLDVHPNELARQYRREVDLAKILAKLYEQYVELVETSGRMTARDASIAARRCIAGDAHFGVRLRERHGLAFVDDAQVLSAIDVRLLEAVFGKQLRAVTLCGDPASAISSVKMTAGDGALARASVRVELKQQYRAPVVEVHRDATPRQEAAQIAERIDGWLGEGVAPHHIAVLFRSVRHVSLYEAALLERGIPTLVAGDVNLFADRRALDAIALLWNVYDPFRHEWLLRTLAGAGVALSDASLALLCSEPPDPQRALFAFDEEPAPTARAGRWDPKRDLRLGWNVVRDERDDALSDEARVRVRRFRKLREGWIEAMHSLAFDDFVRKVWREGLAREGTAGSARARAQQSVLKRLLERLNDFVDERPESSLGDVLEYAEQRMTSDLETCDLTTLDSEGFVPILSVEAAQGREFDRVVVANVRPGAFPRWYAPDAFLFSPRYGMIPKENSGDARASRTAKYTFYTFRMKSAQGYNDRERRAFEYALRRARKNVLVTASGPSTRGVTAPEFLEELR